MVDKKIFTGLSCGILVVAGTLFFASDKIAKNLIETNAKQEKTTESKISKPIPMNVKRYDLYSSSLYDLPLASILEISKLNEETKKKIDQILEQSQGFYYLINNEKEHKISIVLQNPITIQNTYNRHNLEIAEISTIDNSIKYFSPAYQGIEGEISNAVVEETKKADVWKFDKSFEPYRPTKHITYDEKRKTKFTEYWNYSDKEEIKYMLKNGKGKVISMLKETYNGDTNYRQEHLFYNEDKITMNFSINYDGANITRFSYYDSYTPESSTTIITEYENGLKTKEEIYDKDYQLIKTIRAIYVDNERKTINEYDISDKLVKSINAG